MENKIDNYARENSYRINKVPQVEKIYDKMHREKSDKKNKEKRREHETYEIQNKHLLDVRA